MYQTLLPEYQVTAAQRLCDSFSRVRINGTICRSSSNSGILANWLGGEYRPGRVRRFLGHDVFVKNGQGKRQKLSFVLAEVEWFKNHPKRNWFPAPLEVWCNDFENHSEMSFIPVHKIQRQCLTVQYKVNLDYGREKVTVTIPLIGRFSF